MIFNKGHFHLACLAYSFVRAILLLTVFLDNLAKEGHSQVKCEKLSKPLDNE